jgi:ABC-type multidrug transport system fused ATPase/permease subunit
MRLRAEALQRLQLLAIGYFDRQDVGRLHARLVQDTEAIDIMANYVSTQFIVSVITAAVIFTILCGMSVTLTMLVLVVVPLYWLGQRVFKKRIVHWQKLYRKEYESLSFRFNELLRSMRLIRTFNTEDFETQRTTRNIENYSQLGVKVWTLSTLYQSGMETLMGLSLVMVIFGGSTLVIRRVFTVGDLVAYYSFLTLLLNPLRDIFNNANNFLMGRAALDSFYEVLDYPELDHEQKRGASRPVNGEVEFKSVSFRYDPLAQTQALKEVSVRVRPGQLIALVGPSGSGKSTFINMLLGFYQPASGEILVDGIPLKEYDPRDLRNHMGVVAQESLLLSGTIRSNILYGNPGASQAEVEAAARLACATDFIEKAEQGYDTEIREMGMNLSGGQRQRLAIARAALRDPRILLLDEATSALDTLSERQVHEGLRNLMKGRTTFVIAHRLTTAQEADLILVFRQGEIVERGRHGELLELKGLYHSLVDAQFRSSQEKPGALAVI